MSRWIRLHQSALHNPKIVSLSDRQYRAWTNLLLVADISGDLPKVRDIACHLRMSIQDVELILSELVEIDLVDMSVLDGVRTFKMHNWRAHQYLSDASTDRVRKFRNKNNVGQDETGVKRFSNGDVTPPESESESDTESNFQLSKSSAAREVKSELRFDLNLKSGSDRKGMETLLRQAEGYGLDVADIVEITNRNAKPAKREGYFVALCVNRLKNQLPGLDVQIIRDALNGKHEQHKTVLALLAGALQ